MKTQAILVAAALSSVSAYDMSIHFNYNADADPCHVYDKKACKNEQFCVYTNKPRNMDMGKAERKFYGRHTAPQSKDGSCAMVHVIDRVSLPDNEQNKIQAKFGVGGRWSDVQCSDAYWLKDCKDINQHFAGSGSNKCEWNCETGCVDATGDNASAPYPYEACKKCIPLEQSPAGRVHCNQACDVCMISANINAYDNVFGGVIVLEGKVGDPWVRQESDANFNTAFQETSWGIAMADSDERDVNNVYCKTLGFAASGMYYYSDSNYDTDTNISDYDGGPAWRLAGLHYGYADETNGPADRDGDYLGGHDYMDYIDYVETNQDFPWLKVRIAGETYTNIYDVSFMVNQFDCNGSESHIHECTADTSAGHNDYSNEAQGAVCCTTTAACAQTEDLHAKFENDVFQPWNIDK
jgi:hypothetical protein